ncbi:MAG: PDR/VanB family oxidoreductase [Pseudomonadota bacterium]
MEDADLTLVVRSVRREACDIVSLLLASADGRALPAFTTGAHLSFKLAAGLERQYSLCNESGESGYVVGVRLEAASRGGSAAMHALREGDVIKARPPVNQFEVDWSAEHLVLVAGGIGITPLLAMARAARSKGKSFELHYFARSGEHAAFVEEIRAFESNATLHLGVPVDDVARELRAIVGERRTGAQLYMCGAPPFMNAVREAAAQWPASAIHCEYFRPDETRATAEAAPFDIVVSSTGARFTVAADSSMLQTLEANGVIPDSSCREGLCGMCVVPVLEGIPDHRDDFLGDEARRAGELVALCVSRSKSPVLVLGI